MKKAELHIEELIKSFGDKDYFQLANLLAFYRSFDPTVGESTVNWRIRTLVKTGVIQRIGRGKYKYGMGNNYMPQIPQKALKINNFMKTNFPYLKYLIWNISEINSFAQHLINKDTYYVEVERDAVDAVFEKLRDRYKFVLRLKTNEDVYIGESIIIVRSLITGSPIQLIGNVPTTTIEKLLVDLFTDKEFEFLRGNELTHIFNNAISKYTINLDKLYRYASRKEKKTAIADYIKTIK
jgi:hypothetical protein